MTKRLQRRRSTVDRTLQELHLLGLLVVEDQPYGEDKVRWLYSLAPGIDQAAVASLAAREFTRNVSTPVKRDRPMSGDSSDVIYFANG